jgi:dihydrofolate reductase
MKNIAYIACSLDGFIADRDGKLDWLLSIPNESNGDYGFSEFMEGIDAVLMGRNTFETAAAFPEWPYRKPVYVLSTTLTAVPERLAGRCFLVSGNVRDVVGRLHRDGFKNIYVDGGKTIRSFLREDMLDELIISRTSHVLGRGVPLFDTLEPTLTFRITKVELLNSYLCRIHYARNGA